MSLFPAHRIGPTAIERTSNPLVSHYHCHVVCGIGRTRRSEYCIKYIVRVLWTSFILFKKQNMMLSVLVLLTLVSHVDAADNIHVTLSPSCSCQVTSDYRQLTVDCGYLHPDVDEEQLSHQLDSMLSADHFVEHLTSLSITDTPLTRVPASVCKLLNLTSLNLDRNKLNELPDNCFNKLTKLVTLRAKRNVITRLQDGLFDGLQSLVNLILMRNQIAFIGLRVFSNSSYLTSLRLLDLGFNRLTSLEPWWYYRCIQGNKKSPVRVLLYDNFISNFTNKLNFSYRCGIKRPYGYLNLSWNRITHISYIFNGWNIGGATIYTALMCLINLRGTHPLMRFSFAAETYACDCKDFLFYKAVSVISHSSMLNGVFCNDLSINPDIGQRRQVTTIPLNEFICEQPDRCPSSCRCVYRPANATLHVYCSAANLSSIPLDLPPLPKSYAKYKLDLFNNKLFRHLEHHPYFVNTSILDVSNCGLSEITVEELNDVTRFNLVNFRGNMLESFPRQADTVNISARLRIGNNPWRCACDNSWMIGWLQSLSHQILDTGDIICRSPSRMYGRNVLKSTVKDFCTDLVKHNWTITLSFVAAVILFLVITGIVAYKLRVKFFRRWKFHPFDRDECVGEDMDYDVFLCCSSLDDDPHGSRILGEMEANGYRVCYHERDFLPGQLISDNIGHGIERSKRTVCLISNNFLQRYCLILIQ